MSKKEEYIKQLKRLTNWEPFLYKNSGLPGPRGNIELAEAVADIGTEEIFENYLGLDELNELTDSEKEYILFCGILGLGRLISEGQHQHLNTVHPFASDSRWRVREAVAMALQQWGRVDMEGLLQEVQSWLKGGWLEQRAVAAGLCEPALLRLPEHVASVLSILDTITENILHSTDRQSEGFRALRKGMGYCWSVAVAASPDLGKNYMEKWLKVSDKDIRWIMKENLKKNRLVKADQDWVNKCLTEFHSKEKR